MADQSSSAHGNVTGFPHRLRAPVTDRTAVIHPAWSDVPMLIESSRRALAHEWTDWRHQARREARAEAVRYTSDLTGVALPPSTEGPLIVDGHQPELFHPGVWAKNFGISRLAQQCRGVALHLIVDNDVLKNRAIRVPTGTKDAPQFAWEAFDHPQPNCPWEEARVSDREYFAGFGDRVRRHIEPWGIAPLATRAWSAAQDQSTRTDSLVDGLTAARVSIERSWGLTNLELPVSRLSGTRSFLRFAALLMSRAPEVASVYNSVVHDYRRVNRIRNRSHPVPDLVLQDDWCEVPLRVWRAGDQHRQRPFVRKAGAEFELRDERDVIARWPASSDGTEALAALAGQGIRLRPRALTLTLFARLLLADLFVHGLGGAKYDEMTDALAARMFGAPPPPYLTVSATVWIPLGNGGLRTTPSTDDIGHVRHALRQMQHNPQKFAEPSDPVATALVAEKASLLANEQPTERAARRKRYLRLREINAELAAMQNSRREALTEILRTREHLREAHRVLHNREFSWVLHPEEALREFYEATFPILACA